MQKAYRFGEDLQIEHHGNFNFSMLNDVTIWKRYNDAILLKLSQ
jgi:hypothetical protein